MSFWKKLFGGKSSDIEDVRRSKRDEGEVILNLWYETNGFIISSLRSKAYVASGTDEEKLALLRKRANSDFTNAQLHQVPDSLKAEIKLVGESGSASVGRECTHQFLEIMGGYMALFGDIIRATPSYGFRFDTTQVMYCCTALVKSPDGKLSVRIDK